jgi:serine/threonine-protein kinase RsbW
MAAAPTARRNPVIDELRASSAWLPALSLVAVTPAGEVIGHVLGTRGPLLWEWGLNGLATDIELLTSELVTNAVRSTAGQQQAAIRLQLSRDSGRVLVEVWDADPQSPAPKDLTEDGIPDLQEEGGRGLFLVAALSTCWNWYLTQEPAGKVV